MSILKYFFSWVFLKLKPNAFVQIFLALLFLFIYLNFLAYREVSYIENISAHMNELMLCCIILLVGTCEIKRMLWKKMFIELFIFRWTWCFGREGFRFISSFRLWNDDSSSDWWGSWTSGMFNMLLSYNILIHVFAIWLNIRSSQVCREKTKKPQVWEDVPHING